MSTQIPSHICHNKFGKIVCIKDYTFLKDLVPNLMSHLFMLDAFVCCPSSHTNLFHEKNEQLCRMGFKVYAIIDNR
jgi:hypothetical protein